jgi:diphthamide biosynthesis protein 2
MFTPQLHVLEAGSGGTMSESLTKAPTSVLEREAEAEPLGLAALAEEVWGRKEVSEFDALLELPQVASFLCDADPQRVALQLPDGMLGLASRVVERLQSLLALPAAKGRLRGEVDMVVLGDTTFGSDMVDIVASLHYDPAGGASNSRGIGTGESSTAVERGCSLAVVHFGPATLTSSLTVPVFFALGRSPVRVLEVAAGIDNALGGRNVLLSAESSMLWCLGDVQRALRCTKTVECVPVVQAHLHPSGAACRDETRDTASSDEMREDASSADASEETADQVIVHIGDEDAAVRRLTLARGSAALFVIDSQGADLRELPVGGKALTRHFLHSQRARIASSIALVAGTMSARGFLPLLSALRRLIRSQGKRCTTLMVGKLNPTKLANFDGVDVFVLVGAGDSSLLSSSTQKTFAAPVLTVHELLLGLLPDEIPWEAKIITDVSELVSLLKRVAPECFEDVPSEATQPPRPTEEELLESDADAPFFSPITGKLHEERDSELHTASSAEGGTALVVAAERAITVHGSAAHVLSQKEWQGLDPSLPEGRTTAIDKGWDGVASSFEHERQP